MTKISKLAGVGALLLVVIGAGLAFVLFGDNVTDTVIDIDDTQTSTDERQAVTSQDVRTWQEAVDVNNAPDGMSLGFNNAEQIVENGEGTSMVAVVDGSTLLVSRSSDGDVVETRTLGGDAAMLPAISRDGNLVAVGWSEAGQGRGVKVIVSQNGGRTFGAVEEIGRGTGLSLSASAGRIVAVWHEGTKSTASKIRFALFNGTQWSDVVRVDESDATPLWASVFLQDEKVFVTWRDNRDDGYYSIWLRRSLNLGEDWEDEQHVVEEVSGDPDICVTDERVWIAHQGHGKISYLYSVNGGETFGDGEVVGDGWFAHLSCSDDVVVVAWEQTTGAAEAEGKKPGWAFVGDDGVIASGNVVETDSGAVTAYIMPDGDAFELVWIKPGSDSPLTGILRHTFIPIP